MVAGAASRCPHDLRESGDDHATIGNGAAGTA
jgi:hypothetical protein